MATVITDEERSEVARRLRAVKPIWYDISDPMCMLVTSIGFSCTANGDCHGSSERRECVMRVFPRLADLIEPPTQCPHYHSDRHYCSIHEDIAACECGRDALAELAGRMRHSSEEDQETLRWVREHGGLDSVKERLGWVVGHCSTERQLDFDFWLSGRVMHELGFEEDMADRDEVERRLLARLMPDGMEWPCYDTGDKVRIGSEFESEYGHASDVKSIILDSMGFTLNLGSMHHAYGERVKRPAPKVLDADGVEIRVGDTVWDVETGCKHTVRAVNDNETVEFDGHENRGWFGKFLTHRAPVLAADGRPLREGETVWDENGDELVIGALEDGGHTVACRYADVGDAIPVHGMWSPSDLIHERPVADTWERIEEDAGCTATKYNERRGTIFTTKQQVARDLVRRAKKLAGDA